MTAKDSVLCFEEDLEEGRVLERALTRLDYAVETTPSPATALDLAANGAFEVVVADLGTAKLDGLVFCHRLLGMRPDMPVIVLTRQESMEGALSALNAGAYDFLTKPIDARLLGLRVARAIELHRLRAQVLSLKAALGEPGGPLDGDSPAIKHLNDLVLRVGASEASVLIHGEAGTGKRVVAHALHSASARKNGPFVALNCEAVSSNLLESELFGHTRAPFMDARNLRRGALFEASGGTLFLDGIGELDLDLQARLLRALQKRTVRRMGSSNDLPFDVRVVAATHRDLENDVSEDRFRQDLLYHINVVRIDVPPLRERGGDVLTLASLFLRRACERSTKRPLEMTPQVAERLLAYDWPGNVHELENAMERGVALARSDKLTLEDLPEKIRTYRPDRFVISADDANEVISLDELERRYIVRVVGLLGGNKARAAQLLDLDRRTLYRKLERYGSHISGVRSAITGGT